MKRVLLEPIPPIGQTCEPDREEAHHLLKVRRVGEGERIEVIDGCGGLAVAEVAIHGRKVSLKIVEKPEVDRESPLHLALGLGLPVSLQIFDHSLPSLVQLGVTTIRLAPVAYGGRMKKDWEKYRARLDHICIQALKQSGRLLPPQLIYHATWDELCSAMAKTCVKNLLFHPDQATAETTEEKALKSLGLLVGPEGGFTEEEVDIAKSHGINTKDLGPRILKMETVLVGACYWAQSTWGDGSGKPF